MPQLILPLIPKGATEISNLITVQKSDDSWTYFYSTHPIYTHPADDHRMFRLVTSQLIDSGACRNVDIINTFGVSKSSVIRNLKKLRNEGYESFFKKRKGRRGGSVLKPDVLEKAQILLDQGNLKQEVAEELGVKYDTLRKAVSDGRLHEPELHAVTKSSRNIIDTAASEEMGTACTRVVDRVLASTGKGDGAVTKFETCLDVPKGGVLCALPSLLSNGLLNGAEKILGKVKGYYSLFHILLLLGFMFLCRIKTMEKLRGYAPGEFGKLLGLDRIPEVRCLRKKLDDISSHDAADYWAAHLCKHWLDSEPDIAGTLYVDGHVSVYHGSKTKLPRKYVSRQRLCLRGTTDYWVNDAIGRPFFVVEKAVDPGLVKTLKEDIIPRLLEDVPDQPTDTELENNPHLYRFIIVFDREGYSPEFFIEMWQQYRIACISYHKFPGKNWNEDDFEEYKVTMPSGEIVEMILCEKESLVGSGKKAIWMREVRKLTKSGHQTSIISTAFGLDRKDVSAKMLSRWCQENFFKYMMQHFDIDQINAYGTRDFSDTEMVVNPVWRKLNRNKNSIAGKLNYSRANFTKMTMHPETEKNSAKYEKWLKKKGELLEEIRDYEYQLEEIKQKLKQTDKHIPWIQLNDEDKFYQLPAGRMRLIETVKMIAYRAETTMVGLLIESNVDSSAARRLLQDLFLTEADIIPASENNQLHIRVHSASRPAVNRVLLRLFKSLNDAEIKYPGTDLTLVYELAGCTDSIIAPDDHQTHMVSE
jgi:transposase